MSNHFWKNFHLCFSKLKCLPLIQSPPPPPNQDDHNRPSPTSPTTSTIIKNFNSLYDLTSSDSTPTASRSLTLSTVDFFSASSDDSDDTDSPLDFATIFASQRLFFSSPGRSNSIFESPDTKQEDPDNTLVITGSVKVPKYSLDPYIDFRRSMQEMVEARNPMDVTSEWEYLNELLLCYLTLNPKHTHKYIIRAFSDLVICILSASPSSSAANDHCREPKNRRQRYISRQLQVAQQTKERKGR